ncbi:MAG: metallophosphoesterase family protein, partial [Candidatus Coatesbacteria bacterium]|nr:metallophosphoesterase family protein [Candidatus Coatesbacteria bacterium]
QSLKYYVISDVHANLEALEAVLETIPEDGRIASLGDIVGYGPDPNECIKLISERAYISTLGNHDYGVLGLTEIDLFNRVASEAISWTRENLSRASWTVLNKLKDRVILEKGIATFTHASPYQPSEWHYIITHGFAKMGFATMRTPLCFVGHSHQPIFIVESPEGSINVVHCQEQPSITYDMNDKYIINVGSVGQPRDGINKASYAVWDDVEQTVSIERVAYNYRATQRKIYARSLPSALALRLENGL